MLRRHLLFILVVIAALFYFWAIRNDYREEFNLIGKAAPAFGLVDEEGNELRLADLKGNLVMVHFWATWCFPCLEEIPVLDRLVKLYAGENLKLVAVSMDENRDDVRKFRAKVGFDFPVYFDPDFKVAEKFGTYRLPETYFIDRNGLVVEKAYGAQNWLKENWQQRIKELLPAQDDFSE